MSRRLSPLLPLIFTALAAAQTTEPDGIWHSDERYKGEPRVVIELKTTSGKIEGTVTMRGVIDDDNNSTTLNLVIDSAKIEAGRLTFQTKLPDDNITEWEMTISGATATTNIVADRDGPYSDPQRWRMKRADSKN